MFVQQRKHPRFKISLPVEVHAIVDGETSVSPLRCATSDICLGGCYIESMYPFPVGANLELKLQVADTLLIFARVVTCDPQFGNGIEFSRMLPEDHDALSNFLDQIAQEDLAPAHKTQ